MQGIQTLAPRGRGPVLTLSPLLGPSSTPPPSSTRVNEAQWWVGAGLTCNGALQPELSSRTRDLHTPSLPESPLMPPVGANGWLSWGCCGGAARVRGSHEGRWGHPVSGCAAPQDSTVNAWHPTTEQTFSCRNLGSSCEAAQDFVTPTRAHDQNVGLQCVDALARRPGAATGAPNVNSQC